MFPCYRIGGVDMLGLPRNTEFNKRIPKQKFYDNLTVSPTLKRSFVEQIKTIYWRNKIATSTVNLAAGENVTELEVFEIALNQQSLDENVLKQIDKEIPYHILFVLSFEDKVQAWIGYKEVRAGNNAFKVSSYYHTVWLKKDDLQLKLDGFGMDVVYENYVRQIAGDILMNNKAIDLKESVEKAEQRTQLQKQIIVLQSKVRKEKQFNKQMELNTQLKNIKKELEAL